jgi:hypothetical protein
MLKGFLQHETIEDNRHPGDYRVEAIDSEGDGDIYTAIFVGPDAKQRAEEYAAWKNTCRESTLSMAS